ncbi:zinc knuckle CX2CX4HX4C containing protein [Tanacetum coccineum]
MIVNHYVALYVPHIPFPGCLKQHAEEALVSQTLESLKEIKINRPFVKEIRKVDRTISVSIGMIKTLLLKINKFIFLVDFVILDMIEDFRMPLILGRPLLETAHVEIEIFRKQISLDMGNEKLLFKLEDNLNEIHAPIESAYAVRDIELRMGYQSFNILNIDDDLFLYNSTSCLKTIEFNYLLSIDEDIFTYDIVVQESDEERACG